MIISQGIMHLLLLLFFSLLKSLMFVVTFLLHSKIFIIFYHLCYFFYLMLLQHLLINFQKVQNPKYKQILFLNVFQSEYQHFQSYSMFNQLLLQLLLSIFIFVFFQILFLAIQIIQLSYFNSVLYLNLLNRTSTSSLFYIFWALFLQQLYMFWNFQLILIQSKQIFLTYFFKIQFCLLKMYHFQ